MDQEKLLHVCESIYKQTLGYSLEKIEINEDGTTTHLHSDEFLDEHPERRQTPEFTEAEEFEQMSWIAKLAKEDYENFGPLYTDKK
jgi:hypothetical protein